MSLREELENAIRVASMPIAGWCREGTCTRLIRDHGKSLVEAVRDADRYRHLKNNCLDQWEDANTGEPTNCTFNFSGPGHDIDAAIDAAMKGDG